MKAPNELFSMLTKSYYMVFLKYAMSYLSQKDFSEYLSTAWICDENPNSDPNFTMQNLVGLFKKADPEALMTPEEREQLQALPDPVTVYRGVTSFNAKRIKALSWTLDRDTAQWFANRFGEKGTVYKGISNQYVSDDKCIVDNINLIRRLTPLECERLQGFPDGWTNIPGASDSAAYKALGNSVAIPCVDYVIKGIAAVLREEKRRRRGYLIPASKMAA